MSLKEQQSWKRGLIPREHHVPKAFSRPTITGIKLGTFHRSSDSPLSEWCYMQTAVPKKY